MKYSAMLFACVAIVSAGSIAQKVEATPESNTTNPPNAEKQYEALDLLEQLEIFQYAQDYRNKCVSPSESFYYALGVLEKSISDDGTLPSSEEIRDVVNSVKDDIQATKGDSQIKRPELDFASSPEILAGLEVTSEQCIEQTLSYFNELSEKYTAMSEGQELPSDTSVFSAYLDAKSALLLRSYSLETNEYRLHQDTDIFTLDGYTEFMFRVYQFTATSSGLLGHSELNQAQRKELADSFRALKESRNKIRKDFTMFSGLELTFRLANEGKETQQVSFADAFKQQEAALNASIDTFYPYIEAINAEVDRPTPDLAQVAQLMLPLDSSLNSHERRVSNIPIDVKKTLADMIMQAK